MKINIQADMEQASKTKGAIKEVETFMSGVGSQARRTGKSYPRSGNAGDVYYIYYHKGEQKRPKGSLA